MTVQQNKSGNPLTGFLSQRATAGSRGTPTRRRTTPQRRTSSHANRQRQQQLLRRELPAFSATCSRSTTRHNRHIWVGAEAAATGHRELGLGATGQQRGTQVPPQLPKHQQPGETTVPLVWAWCKCFCVMPVVWVWCVLLLRLTRDHFQGGNTKMRRFVARDSHVRSSCRKTLRPFSRTRQTAGKTAAGGAAR